MTKKLLAKAWEPIKCPNGHPQYLTKRPLYDDEWGFMEGCIPIGRDMTLSAPYYNRCTVCGEDIFVWTTVRHNNLGVRLHIRAAKESKNDLS